MKKFFYLLGILSLTVSCGTANYMYDDVYDVAEGKSLTEDGYTDLIKDNEKNHKVVVDKEDKVTFGGYYPSNNQSSGGTSFSNNNIDNNNCNCACGHYGNSNQWRYYQPGWIYTSPNSLWFNNCSCNHWNNSLAYHYASFGNVYNLYGYYDYWGGWNPYYVVGMDPYGYYAYQYGWYPYQWNNYNNNGIFNGNNIVFGNPSGGSNTNEGGNHFYGHRNPSSTSSSNTTVYAHTVKDIYVEPTTPITGQSAILAENGSVLADGTNGTINKPTFTLASAHGSHQTGTTFTSDPIIVNQSPQTISTNTGANTAFKPDAVVNTNSYVNGTTNTVSATNHIPASNQFEAKYPTGTATRTGGAQGTGTQHANPVNQSSTTPGYYTPPVVTNTSGTSNTNSTSRSTNSSYNSTNTNSNSGSTTTSHRSTTSTTNSGSGSSTTSGGSRSTSTSRR